MSNYHRFESRNCDAQFDDNSCKRYPPKEHSCNEKEHCSCCKIVLPDLRGLSVHKVRLVQEVRKAHKVYLDPEARQVPRGQPAQRVPLVRKAP